MKKNLYTLFKISLLIGLGQLNAAQNWTQKTDLPGAARNGAVCFTIGTKAYISTGQSSDTAKVFLNDLWEWDMITDSWTSKADFPGKDRYQAASFSIGSKGYIMSGTRTPNDKSGLPSDYQLDLWEWDQATDTWTQKINLPAENSDGRTTKRYGAIAFAIGSKAYFTNGCNWGSNFMYQDVWEWDQLNDTWTQLNDCPAVGRQIPACFVINSKAYMVGGEGVESDATSTLILWEFDPSKASEESGGWTEKSIIPSGITFGGNIGGAAGFSIESKGYVVTGGPATSNKDVWEWDQTDDKWTKKNTFPGDGRKWAVGFSIGEKGYLCSGQGGSKRFQDLWEYNPQGDTSIVKDIPSSINSVMTADNTSIYPNPCVSGGTLKINTAIQNSSLRIFDITGHLLYEEKIAKPGDHLLHINTETLSEGIYLYDVRTIHGDIMRKMIITR